MRGAGTRLRRAKAGRSRRILLDQFPFTLYYAVMFGQSWKAGYAAGASLVIALFTVVRIEQMASFRVIAVELIVGSVAVAVAAVFRSGFGGVLAAGVASIIAFAGLAL